MTTRKPATDADTEPEAPAARKIASGDVVRYIGTADVREIDVAAWKNVDVTDQGKVVWNAANRHKILAADLSDAALEYLATDPGFVVGPVAIRN